MPLAAAQVAVPRSWEVASKQCLGAAQIALLPRLLHQVHVRSVSLCLCQLSLAINAKGGHGCSDAEDEQQEPDRSAQCGQSRLAPTPAPYLFGLSDWPRQDRFTPQPALQFFGQSLGRTITTPRVFLEALEANGFQVTVHGAIERRGRARLRLQHQADRLEGGSSRERRCRGEQMVKDGA